MKFNSKRRFIRRFSKIFVASIVLLFTVPHIIAQDDGEHIEDILRWFPRGHYDMVLHHNWEALRSAETYPLYVTFFRPFDDPLLKVIELPFILRQDLKSRTVAQLQHIETRAFDDAKTFEEHSPARRQAAINESIAGRYYSFESTGERLMVFRYYVLDDLLYQAVNRGDIFPTDLLLLERPVYTFITFAERERRQFFAWASPAQELLIAGSPALLERMVAAGAGQGLRLLDGRDYDEIRYLTEELGQSWQMRTRYPHLRRMLAVMRSRRVDQALITRFEDLLEVEPKFAIQARRLDETLSFFTVTHFENYEVARKWMEQKSLSQNVGILSSDFLRQNLLLFFRPQSFERLGSTVVSRLFYEESTVSELWAEWEEEQERQAELQTQVEDEIGDNF